MSTKWHIWFDAHENTKTVGGDDVQDGFFGMLEKSDFWFRSAELPCTFSTQKELVWLVKQLMSQHPQLTAHCDVQINWRVFREGIQPLWEDPANAAGGKWAMSFQRRDEHGLYKMCRVLGAVQAAAIPEAEAVTGVVLSIKNWGCRLSIWVNHIPPANRVSLGVEKLTKLMRVHIAFGLALESCMSRAFVAAEVHQLLLAQRA
jgi:hypothetical protein